jgi:hypothetical protein
MTQIYLHPSIADHFVEYDYSAINRSPADGSANDLRRAVIKDYIDEKVILLRNVRIDADYELLRSTSFPQQWQYKKFPALPFEADIRKAGIGKSAPRLGGLPSQKPHRESITKFCQDVFNGDWSRYFAFQDTFLAVNDATRDVVNQIFRGYSFRKQSLVWRLAETRVENLHFDNDRDCDVTESVRLYVNIDDVPRMWHTTHTLSTLARRYYKELNLANHAGKPSEHLLNDLSVRLFGNWQLRGREQFPRHMILFEPFDVWLVDGRTVPHQVIYGRRVVSSFFLADNADLPKHHQTLGSKMAALHGETAAAVGDDQTSGQLIAFPEPFPKGGAPTPNQDANLRLKEDWEKMYVESMSQRVVRL